MDNSDINRINELLNVIMTRRDDAEQVRRAVSEIRELVNAYSTD